MPGESLFFFSTDLGSDVDADEDAEEDHGDSGNNIRVASHSKKNHPSTTL
jgi:hypothetical protein